jgi:hypothetical protein
MSAETVELSDQLAPAGNTGPWQSVQKKCELQWLDHAIENSLRH